MPITPPEVSNRWALFIGALSTLLALLGIFTLSLLNSSTNEQRQTSESRTTRLGQLTEIQNRLTQNQLTMARATLTTDPDEIRQHTEVVERNIAAIHQVWAVFKATPMTRWERQLADTFDRHRTRLEQEWVQAAVAALRAQHPEEAKNLMQGRYLLLSAPMHDSMDALMRAHINASAHADVIDRSSHTSWVSLATLLGALLAALLGLLIIQERSTALIPRRQQPQP
ncbi:MAG: Tar ligand binding domain-containing protein [Pseudomonadota bacterium]